MVISKAKKFLALAVAFLPIIVLTLTLEVHAANVGLVADKDGLWIEPENVTALFDVAKMTPGDKFKSRVTVRNAADFSFTMSVEIRNLHTGREPDPAELFVIAVYRDDVKLDEFRVAGGSSYPLKHTFSGKFLPGRDTQLDFTVEFPGEKAGNEYQEKKARLQWVFTAVADEIPGGETPQPRPPAQLSQTTPSPDTDTTAQTQDGDLIDLPAGEVPLTEIPNEEVPLASIPPLMPKTGEAPLWYNIVFGLLLVAAGVVMAMKMLKPKKEDAACRTCRIAG